MTYLPPAAHAWFANQHGVASLDQLLGTGLNEGQVEHLVDRGALVNIVRGAYATPSVHIDQLSRCAALCLARPHVAIAGPTAGRLWGFRRVGQSTMIHLIGPPGSNPAVSKGVRTYHTSAIHPTDVIDREDGIRVTSRARTALDLTRFLPSDDHLAVIEQAIRDGALTDAEMRRVAADWVERRPWVRTFLRQLDRRLPGGAAESDPEVRVGDALRHRGIAGIVRQLEIDLPGFGPVRFDLAIPDVKVAVEIDLHPTHEEMIGAERDHRRDDASRRAGWAVMRIDRRTYHRELERALDSIAETIRLRRRKPA